jgi:phospholipid/cholesterol/gamma-HCH transport system substrate-binding protein
MIRIAIKFGAFVLVCLFFTGYLAFTIGNLDVRDPLDRNSYTLTATFDDVTGLLVNDNVKVAGVVVGKVTGVSTEAGRAVVKMRIDNDHDDIPKEGTTAGIRWRNLIGQRYVYLYPGTSGGVALQGGDEIEETVSVVDLGELFEQLGPIVTAIDPAQVNRLLETLTQAFDGREDEIGNALDDLATLARGLASRDDAIGRLVENLDTVAATLNRRDVQIEAMLNNLVTISEAFGDNTATLDAALTELGAFGTDLNGVLTNNATELDRLLGNLALVTDTAVSKLPELDAFLASFAETSEAIFRAGNRGEFLNQKILCAFVAPPADSTSGCPIGDPITGLSSTAQAFDDGPVSGGAAISSLLTKAVEG